MDSKGILDESGSETGVTVATVVRRRPVPRDVRWPIHDLKSFLYLLMWICTSYAGPMSAREPGFDPYQFTMGQWFSGDPAKRDIMFKLEKEFRAFLDDTFDPYFDDLKDCVCEIRRAIFFRKEVTTHEEIYNILEIHACAQQPADKRRRPRLLEA